MKKNHSTKQGVETSNEGAETEGKHKRRDKEKVKQIPPLRGGDGVGLPKVPTANKARQNRQEGDPKKKRADSKNLVDENRYFLPGVGGP